MVEKAAARAANGNFQNMGLASVKRGQKMQGVDPVNIQRMAKNIQTVAKNGGGYGLGG